MEAAVFPRCIASWCSLGVGWINAFVVDAGYPDKNTVCSQTCWSQCCCWLVECDFTSTETVGLLGTRAQDVHLDFHTPPEVDVVVDRFQAVLRSRADSLRSHVILHE